MSESPEHRVADEVRGPADPLPQRYVTDTPPLGGRIKVRPEDFLVDEVPLYEPCGEGEHIYLGLEKTRVSHSELIGTLCRHFGVRETAIGFAGMKDKHGITRQTVSVHLHKDPPDVNPGHDRIKVLWAMRHGNKLRRGHLRGNRFSIRIREVDALAAPRAHRALRELERIGVPCYFGPQRFGYRCNNHVIGVRLLREDWAGVLDELLGAGGSPFPEHQRERRELYDAGRYEDAARQWTKADRGELIAIRALVRGRTPQQACQSIGRTSNSFWLNAFQSALFNAVLDERIAAGTLDRLQEGDLAWNHATRAVFAIGDRELADEDTLRRLREMEISPSGPLWGSNMTRAAHAVDVAETRSLEGLDLTLDELLASPRVPQGARRPLRAPLRHVEVDGGTDEHGHYVRVAFDLPRGMYATVVLREIMKAESEQRTANSEPRSQ